MDGRIRSELRQAVQNSRGAALEVVDLDSNEHYVLLRVEASAQVPELLAQMDVRDVYPNIANAVGPDGWEDPPMDVYNILDSRGQ